MKQDEMISAVLNAKCKVLSRMIQDIGMERTYTEISTVLVCVAGNKSAAIAVADQLISGAVGLRDLVEALSPLLGD